MDRASGTSGAPTKPWTARKAMSWTIDRDIPLAAEPSKNSAMPIIMTGLRPYTSASLFLYEQLYGTTNGGRAPTSGAKTYFPFKPNQLSPTDQTQPVTAIRDPFGNPYGYSTEKAATPGGNVGFNPTFDLWSIADGAPGTNQTKWIKNW